MPASPSLNECDHISQKPRCISSKIKTPAEKKPQQKNTNSACVYSWDPSCYKPVFLTLCVTGISFLTSSCPWPTGQQARNQSSYTTCSHHSLMLSRRSLLPLPLFPPTLPGTLACPLHIYYTLEPPHMSKLTPPLFSPTMLINVFVSSQPCSHAGKTHINLHSPVFLLDFSPIKAKTKSSHLIMKYFTYLH